MIKCPYCYRYFEGGKEPRSRPSPAPTGGPRQIDCSRCQGSGNLCNHPKSAETDGESCPIDDRDRCDDKCQFMIPCDVCQHDAAIVAATLDKLAEWVEAMRDVADTRAPDDEDIDEIRSQGEKVAYTIVLEKIASLRSTPSAPEQEERR